MAEQVAQNSSRGKRLEQVVNNAVVQAVLGGVKIEETPAPVKLTPGLETSFRGKYNDPVQLRVGSTTEGYGVIQIQAPNEKAVNYIIRNKEGQPVPATEITKNWPSIRDAVQKYGSFLQVDADQLPPIATLNNTLEALQSAEVPKAKEKEYEL
jgi:hypothetical protein